MSGASGFVASCGYRLSEVGLSEFRKPQVAGSIPVVGSSLFKCFELKPLLSHLTCQCLVADSCGLTLHFRIFRRLIESVYGLIRNQGGSAEANEGDSDMGTEYTAKERGLALVRP